jgi:hypothetical protein
MGVTAGPEFRFGNDGLASQVVKERYYLVDNVIYIRLSDLALEVNVKLLLA